MISASCLLLVRKPSRTDNSLVIYHAVLTGWAQMRHQANDLFQTHLRHTHMPRIITLFLRQNATTHRNPQESGTESRAEGRKPSRLTHLVVGVGHERPLKRGRSDTAGRGADIGKHAKVMQQHALGGHIRGVAEAKYLRRGSSRGSLSWSCSVRAMGQ